MNKRLMILVWLFLCVVLFFAVQKLFFKNTSYHKEVVEFATKLNKTCPSMIDPETRLDNVNALPENRLQFNYTLINQIRDSLAISSLKSYMEPMILSKIKTSPVLKKIVDKNVTWIYSYYDKYGIFIFKVTITPEQFD